MKKVLIATAALLTSTCLWQAEAASVKWQTSSGIDKPNGETLMPNTFMAYLIEVNAQTATAPIYEIASGRLIPSETVLARIFGADGSTPLATKLSEVAVTVGANTKTFAFSLTGTSNVADLSVLFVYDAGEHIYYNYSDRVTVGTPDFRGNVTHSFEVNAGDPTTNHELNLSGATGWVMAVIPEPSSGLLMLLGAGLMALRRRV